VENAVEGGGGRRLGAKVLRRPSRSFGRKDEERLESREGAEWGGAPVPAPAAAKRASISVADTVDGSEVEVEGKSDCGEWPAGEAEGKEEGGSSTLSRKARRGSAELDEAVGRWVSGDRLDSPSRKDVENGCEPDAIESDWKPKAYGPGPVDFGIRRVSY
jgi:hypothetical protein